MLFGMLASKHGVLSSGSNGGFDGVSFGVIFASELVTSYALTPQATGLDVTRQWRMFAMDSKQAPVTFAADHALTLDKCANTSVCVHYASPAIQTRSVPNCTT